MSAVYKPFKEHCLDSSGPNLTAVNIKEVLVDAADYTPDTTNHNYLDDIPAGGRVATSGNYGGKTITGGVYDHTDQAPTFAAVTGDVCEYVVGYNDTPGTDATKDLIYIVDSGTGLPFTPNGGNANVVRSSYVFAL